MKTTKEDRKNIAYGNEENLDFQYQTMDRTDFVYDPLYEARVCEVLLLINDEQLYTMKITAKGDEDNPTYGFPEELKPVKHVVEYELVESIQEMDYVPKFPATSFDPKALYSKPDDNLNYIEKWIHFKRIEKQVKKEMDDLRKQAEKEVIDNDKFYKNNHGKVLYIEQETKKPKDSLKVLLQQKGLLELCKKDDLDMSKVMDLVDAGELSEAEISPHIKTTPKKFLQYKEK